jgi:SAM-dependent methyltransferase
VVRETWAVGDSYEAYVGRWSRAVATRFVTWLAVPPLQRWLDVGCGTGALTAAILAESAPVEVMGVDPSEGFLDAARHRVTDGRAVFRVGDARSLPVADRRFDVVASALVLNFVPEPRQAVAESLRAVRPGGVVGAYVWDYAGGMEMIRHFWDAAVALDPAAAALDEGARFPLCRPEPLHRLFTDCGLSEVSVAPIDVPTPFADFADYWDPFLGGQGPAPGYAVSLPPDRRTTLRDRVRAGLPIDADGRIRLAARAWTVRGTAPDGQR